MTAEEAQHQIENNCEQNAEHDCGGEGKKQEVPSRWMVGSRVNDPMCQ